MYVNVEIAQKNYNAYCMPKPFFVGEYFDSWDPRIHGHRNYLQGFYVTARIEEYGTNKYYPLVMFQNCILKNEIMLYRHDGQWNSFVVL